MRNLILTLMMTVALQVRGENYLQFYPTALTFGLNIANVEGRSSTARLAACSAMSYAMMYAVVQPIKHLTSETRPDRSSDDAFPSGHTATAFVGASILHKEYGMTVSPWYSVAGYGAATATGLMRVMKNRHWTGDVMVGAGLGIIATEIAYRLGDILFKDKGLKREELPGYGLANHRPSFIGLSMGMGLSGGTLDFSGSNIKLKCHSTTTAALEGAYFFSRHVGAGCRLAASCTPVSGWENSTESLEAESSHLTEYTADTGMYFSLPISKRLSIGTKALVGVSFIDGVDINSSNSSVTCDYLTVNGNTTMKYATGLSLTCLDKENSSWRFFCDVDFSRKRYDLLMNGMAEKECCEKNNTRVTFGAAFNVVF